MNTFTFVVIGTSQNALIRVDLGRNSKNVEIHLIIGVIYFITNENFNTPYHKGGSEWTLPEVYDKNS